MGKSSFQAAKAARYATAAGDGEEEPARTFGDGTTDATFHTPAWHQARIAELMRPRITYDEWKAKAKEAEGKLASVAEEEAARMREYRAQLDADRAARMGKPGAAKQEKSKDKDKKKKKKSKKSKKDSKDKKKSKDKKDKKKSKDKKRKRSVDRSSSSSSDSSDSDSDSDSSDDEATRSKRKRGEDEPVKLSEFLRGE